jgi:hypothetical protein
MKEERSFTDMFLNFEKHAKFIKIFRKMRVHGT